MINLDWMVLISMFLFQMTGGEIEIELGKEGFKFRISFKRKPDQK